MPQLAPVADVPHLVRRMSVACYPPLDKAPDRSRDRRDQAARPRGRQGLGLATLGFFTLGTAALAAGLLGQLLAKPSAARAPLSPESIRYPLSNLETFEVGGTRLPVFLLHGYGSSPQDWFPFIETIHLPRGGRFIFPMGPEATVPPEGPVGGRGWWQLRLDSYWPPGSKLPDMSKSRPAGLARSADEIRVLMRETQQRMRAASKAPVLGGFSQGAMVAAETAFRNNMPLRALILLSGTVVDEASWIGVMAKRRGLPVFVAHGRNDQVLPFAASARLQEEMQRAGLAVTWVPFDGGHEIPPPVVDALNQFLAKI